MSAKKIQKPKPDLPRVHPDLPGFNIEINPLGEVHMNYTHEQLNEFLNKNVKDKKFRGRTDIPHVPDAFYHPPAPEDSKPWKEEEGEIDN